MDEASLSAIQQAAQDAEVYRSLTGTDSYTVPEEKYNVHLFLHRVATAEDTTKVGFLMPEEVGAPKYSVRSLQEFSLIADKIIDNDMYQDYFTKWGEIVLATSLSRDGFLVRQATTTTRQVADISKPKKPNKGWFGFKKKDQESQEAN